MHRQKKLKCLDLFSGIGGNALALRSICKTVAYCEIDPFARSVLESNMKRKNLDKAPIFDDVTTLKAVDVPELPDVITASFPCQDISSAGKGAGITGERSCLYKHIFRLVREFRRHRNHRISVIVMENSPMIKHRGLDNIERELRSLGFRFQSVYRKASDVGTRHERRRWCMVAIDKQSDIDIPCTSFRHNFDNIDSIPVLLKIEGQPPANYRRYGSLGNAVVPKVIASVWDEVICSVHVDSQDINRYPLLSYNTPHVTATTRLWPTPIRDPRHWSVRHFTRAGSGHEWGNMANRIFYEQGIQSQFKYTDVLEACKKYVINSEWIEALMGYPTGWTGI